MTRRDPGHLTWDVKIGQLDRKEVKAHAINKEITETLRRRTAQTTRSRRWDAGGLVLACLCLASTIGAGLNSGNVVFQAVIAASGLAIVWFYSMWQARRLQKESFEEEMRIVERMLSGCFEEDMNAIASPMTETQLSSGLSRRELQILREASLGKANKEIASALSIADQTVKNHFRHIFKKLEVTDRTQAVMIAIGNGWLETGTGKATSASMTKPGPAEVKSSDGCRIGG